MSPKTRSSAFNRGRPGPCPHDTDKDAAEIQPLDPHHVLVLRMSILTIGALPTWTASLTHGRARYGSEARQARKAPRIDPKTNRLIEFYATSHLSVSPRRGRSDHKKCTTTNQPWSIAEEAHMGRPQPPFGA
jgi:hypothetical protein